MEIQSLRGSCSCGRNRYVVEIPSDRTASQAIVFTDNSSATRRTHASPLTAFLRVPLSWLHSSTYAFYPDEDHNSIRRTYTTPLAPETRKQFCGYCGTQLTSWSERRREDADFICLTLGSLLDEDLSTLEAMGVMPSLSDDDDGDDDDDEDKGSESGRRALGEHRGATGTVDDGYRNEGQTQNQRQDPSPKIVHVMTRGSPWFEDMVENSGLARVRRRHGGHVSEDGRTRVEYEIVEVDHGGSVIASDEHVTGKRKYED